MPDLAVIGHHCTARMFSVSLSVFTRLFSLSLSVFTRLFSLSLSVFTFFLLFFLWKQICAEHWSYKKVAMNRQLM